MKGKKIVSLLLIAAMVYAMCPSIFAVEYQINSERDVMVTSNSEYYTVTVPAQLTPGSSGIITAVGNWDNSRVLTVSASDSVVLTNSIDSEDTKTLNVMFDGISQVGNNSGNIMITKDISVDGIENALFGLWSGKIQYTVCMADIYKPNFEDNTWEEIITGCQNQEVPETWEVGDSKDVLINGKPYTVTIIGKNHDVYADGSGVAPLTFQVTEAVGVHCMNTKNTNSGSWHSSDMYRYLHQEVLYSLEDMVKDNIRAVKKYSNLGGADTNNRATQVVESSNKLFLLSDAEITGIQYWDDMLADIVAQIQASSDPASSKAEQIKMWSTVYNAIKQEGSQYEYYKPTGVMTKRPTSAELERDRTLLNYWYNMSSATLKDSDGNLVDWWLRTPDPFNSINFISVNKIGRFGVAYPSSNEFGVSFCFCF